MPDAPTSFLIGAIRVLDLSPEQLGRLPTGDSIIDVGGQPGPMGIGTLMKLDVSDAEHNTWLISYGTRLSKIIDANPKNAVDVCPRGNRETGYLRPWKSFLQHQAVPQCLHKTTGSPGSL